jgi:hypothetical protein
MTNQQEWGGIKDPSGLNLYAHKLRCTFYGSIKN